MNFNKSEELYKKGLKHLVGAVNSPVRAFTSVGGNPLFIDRAKGPIITDVDGNEYVDYVLSYGPMILGHRHKKVQKAMVIGSFALCYCCDESCKGLKSNDKRNIFVFYFKFCISKTWWSKRHFIS